MSAGLHIRAGDPAEPAVRDLIAALDAYVAALYPAESNHLLDIEALRQPHVSLLVAERAGSVSGCGALVRHADYVEIKRVIVAPQARGNGIGRALLDALERRAHADGYVLARLETGIHQPEALALYARAGYQACVPFGDYTEDPLSVFMEKHIAAEPDSAPP